MEYNLSKHSVAYCEKFLDTVNEQLVDADIILPDYCPDIEKILKCTLIPKVYTRHISGGQLTIDGVTVLRILYCDSVRHNTRSFEYTSPFTTTFSLKSTPEQYIVLSFAKCEYINCRALSPRKLSVHGAFSLYAKVMSKGTTEFYGFDDDCDLQTKQREIAVSDMCAMCQEQFSFTEDISVSSNPPVESLLSYETAVRIIDLKSIHNKLMLNAELELKMLYISDLENSKIEHFTSAFEINKIFDCDGVMDDTINVPQLEIMSGDLNVRNDTLNDGSLLSLDVKLCFSNISYVNKNVSVLDDAYSTKYKTESKRGVQNCESNHSFAEFINVAQSSVKVDNMSISKMLDVYCEGVSVSPVISDKKLSLQGKTNVCMLIEDEDNIPCYVERCVDFEFNPEIDRVFDRVELCNSQVKSISFRLVDDNTVDIRIEILTSVVLCDCKTLNPITDIEFFEDQLIDHSDCSLIMYFADKGEEVWDIAKAYNTKQSLLKSENSLDGDIIPESCMLLLVTE